MKARSTGRWTAVAAWVLLALAPAARADGEETALPPEAQRATEFIMYTQWMDAFRNCGMQEPEKLPKRFLAPGSTAALDWAAIIEPNFLPATQADFFRGAIPLAGPFSDRRMVMGLYNPHWNVILLLQTAAELPHTEEEAETMHLPRVTNLRFMSGEAFWGKDPEEPDFTTVLPGGAGRGPDPDEPLAVGICRAQARTMRRFNALYPETADDDPRLKARALGEVDADRDMERIIARVAVRLRGIQGMQETPEWRAVAARLEQVLQLGLRSHMKRYFDSPLHDAFVTTFSKLPKELKQGFRAYGCVANPEGVLYLFVNQDYPRLFATVTVPAGKLRDPEGTRPADFEWYDLDQAEPILKVWLEGERARKQGAAAQPQP